MRGLVKRFQTFPLMPEWVLVQRAKLGEKEAFGKLYEIYLDALYRYIFFRVGNNRELSEDLVQSVFVKAWANLKTFHKGSFKAWLYTIARNTIIDHMRSAKQTSSIDESIVDETKNVEEAVVTRLAAQEIFHAMHVLTDEQQEVLLLRFVNDLSHKEIAGILEKKEDAVRALQYRALQELRRKLSYER